MQLVDPTGNWHGVDRDDVLNLIITTDDMACITLTVNEFKDKAGKNYPVTIEIINPARKTSKKTMSLTVETRSWTLRLRRERG